MDEQFGRGWMFFADMQLRLVNYTFMASEE